MLPIDLNSAIERRCLALGTRELVRASTELTEWYRSGRPAGKFSLGPAHRLAYTAARMPATYAVNVAVLQELAATLHRIEYDSLLDLCAGPGTVLWAAAATLEVRSAVLLERDPGFLALGRELAAEAEWPLVREAVWQQKDLADGLPLPQADLVTISYGLGEIPGSAASKLLHNAWEAAHVALVVVEPGTPAGYAAILHARTLLLELGAHIAAPCPHRSACPIAGTDRWCHFPQRLARTRLHRNTKGADLGFEDEKYSYLITTKLPGKAFESRILGVPKESKPAIHFETCSVTGALQEISVPKRDRPAFRQARRSRWGDVWPRRSDFPGAPDDFQEEDS